MLICSQIQSISPCKLLRRKCAPSKPKSLQTTPTNPHLIPILFISCSGPVLSNTSSLPSPPTHHLLSFDVYTDPSCMDHPWKMPTNVHWVHSVHDLELHLFWWLLRIERWCVVGSYWAPKPAQIRSLWHLCCLVCGLSAAGSGRSFYRNSFNIKRNHGLQQIKGISIKSPTLVPLVQVIGSNTVMDSSPFPCSHVRYLLWDAILQELIKRKSSP